MCGSIRIEPGLTENPNNNPSDSFGIVLMACLIVFNVAHAMVELKL